MADNKPLPQYISSDEPTIDNDKLLGNQEDKYDEPVRHDN